MVWVPAFRQQRFPAGRFGGQNPASGGGGDVPVANTSPPVLAGPVEIGLSPTVTAGTWTGSPTLTYTYRRDGVAVSGLTAVPLATINAHVFVAADIGPSITVAEIPNGLTANQVITNAITFAHATYFANASIFVAQASAVTLASGVVSAWAAQYGGGGTLGLLTLTQDTALRRPTWEATGGAGGRPRIVFDGTDDIMNVILTKNSTWSQMAMGFVGSIIVPGATAARCVHYNTGQVGIQQSATANLLRVTVTGLANANYTTTETTVGLWSMDWNGAVGSNGHFNAASEATAAGALADRPDIRPWSIGADSDATDASNMEARLAYFSETVLTSPQLTHMRAFAAYHTGV